MNDRFLDAVDKLNKIAYSLVDGNANAWAKIALKKGIINHQDSSRIEEIITLRNAIGHGGARYINADENLVREVLRYIDLMNRTASRMQGNSYTGNSNENSVLWFEFENTRMNVSGVQVIGASWGDEKYWPCIGLSFDGKQYQEKIVYKSAKDCRTDMQRLFIFLAEKGVKCCYFDGLIIPRKYISKVVLSEGDNEDWPSVSVTIKNGWTWKAVYTDESKDYKGRDYYYYYHCYSPALELAKNDYEKNKI